MSGPCARRVVAWRRWMRVAAVASAAVMLGGCSGDALQDLRQYVDQVKAKKGGRMDPMPEIKPFEAFAYRPDNRRSPFDPWSSQVSAKNTVGSHGGGPAPDPNRRREVLEAFPLDTLKMVGTLEQKGTLWAVVRASDGIVYRVTRGNHLGQNHGRIVQIGEAKVDLIELVPDGVGGWVERRATLALVE